MPTRTANLKSPTARSKLPVAKKCIWVRLAPGVALGYRRNAGPGTWSVRSRGAGAEWVKRIAFADDQEPAAPPAVLTYWQAQEQARRIVRHQPREVFVKISFRVPGQAFTSTYDITADVDLATIDKNLRDGFIVLSLTAGTPVSLSYSANPDSAMVGTSGRIGEPTEAIDNV